MIECPLVIRSQVQNLEKEIKQLPQIEPPIAHLFCDGMYARPMLLQKGDCVVGKIHTHAQINILSLGEVSVLTHEGLKRVRAGFHYIAPPGSQRAFYAHEESLWTVILRTDETDIEAIEREFVVETEQQYVEFQKRVLWHS